MLGFAEKAWWRIMWWTGFANRLESRERVIFIFILLSCK